MKNKLKRFRNLAGLSLQDLGDSCGITRQYIWHLETERGDPSLKTAYKIAKILQLDVTTIWPNEIEIEEKTITVRRVK